MSEARLATLESALGYRFHDPELLKTALVHRSAPNERPERYPQNNERMEFLGDAVLDLVIARALFQLYPDASEGELTRYKATLVSEVALADLARTLNLGSYLVLGRGEDVSGGRDKSSLLSDALEAVLGAIYLDRGIGEVERVVFALCEDALKSAPRMSAPRGDYKTALQEWTQANGLGLPVYQVIDESGPDHARSYTVAVIMGGAELARGSGSSKRTAERAAARRALAHLAAGR